MTGHMSGIETEYRAAMHSKREIPASICPSFVENMLYASGSARPEVDKEERLAFVVVTERLDDRAEKYEAPKTPKRRQESLFSKHNRLGINNGTWCIVDTDGVFTHNGKRYQIESDEVQYQPVETDFGLLYDMDRILVTDDGRFYDMKYDEVKVKEL